MDSRLLSIKRISRDARIPAAVRISPGTTKGRAQILFHGRNSFF